MKFCLTSLLCEDHSAGEKLMLGRDMSCPRKIKLKNQLILHVWVGRYPEILPPAHSILGLDVGKRVHLVKGSPTTEQPNLQRYLLSTSSLPPASGGECIMLGSFV